MTRQRLLILLLIATAMASTTWAAQRQTKNNILSLKNSITDEDMKAIAALPRLGFSGFLPEDAPADAIA